MSQSKDPRPPREPFRSWLADPKTQAARLRSQIDQLLSRLEGAALAADHLWHRLVGARYHAGLRQESREWYKHHDRDTRRQAVLDHRVRYGTPHRFEVVLEWLEYIGLTLKPFISVGNEDAIARLDRVNEEVATERARYHSDIDF